jgi:hypothetical protein
MDINKLKPFKEGFIATEINWNWYIRAIGSLIYAMLGTRLDIIYAVSVCSYYITNPEELYVKAIK